MWKCNELGFHADLHVNADKVTVALEPTAKKLILAWNRNEADVTQR
jgi:hypothetical protein